MRPATGLLIAGALMLGGCVGERSVPAPAAAPPPVETPAETPPPPPLPAPPSAPPAWDANRVTADAQDVPASVYIVRPGDSLRRISNRTGAGSEAIARENGLAKPFLIHPGETLRIPGGRYHLVKPGQSGIAIARAYGVDWSEIVSLNHLTDPYILRAGQRILLPTSQEVASMSVEQHAAAFRLDLDDLITGSEPALSSGQRPVRPAKAAGETLPATAVVAPPAAFTGRFVWPIAGRILAHFGPQGGGRINDGIDIAAPVGTPIAAAADGIVAYVGDDISSLGQVVLIRHGDGWITAYAHADKLLVTRGQAVKRGQQIATSGQTGVAEQPLLHFEIRQARSPVDPARYLPAH